MIIELILAGILGFGAGVVIFRSIYKIKIQRLNNNIINGLKEQEKLGYSYYTDGKKVSLNLNKIVPEALSKRGIKNDKKKGDNI